ncbi:hypothetical protein [Streptomyces sp. NBC_00467]|uniref:hypothetical protein n=1 Tax=Streptomyces sp. NBC_00467 TaxID=2975752 RepID=UPI002E18F31E
MRVTAPPARVGKPTELINPSRRVGVTVMRHTLGRHDLGEELQAVVQLMEQAE